MPLTSKQEDALNLILDRLSEVDCDWALTGGVSFILQGVDYETSDIDIQTSKEGAQKIMDELSDFVEEELYYRESEKMKSYSGVLRIKNVKVEVMGEVQKKVGGEWEEPVKVEEHLKTTKSQKRKVPVLDLEYEVTAYRKMGREEKAEKLERSLKQS